MTTFKPILINKTGVVLPYNEGQYIVATQPFSDGANMYDAGVYVDTLYTRQPITPQGIPKPDPSINFAFCDTDANTAEKAVTILNFNIATGTRISVSFSAANNTESPTLNINNTGAKPIIADGDSVYVKWLAGSIMEFVYDGINWVCIAGYALAGKPVGSHYIQYNGENTPASSYGGNWEIDTTYQGRVLIGSGGTYNLGATGGEEKHTLIVGEIPSHTHDPVNWSGIGLSLLTGSENGYQLSYSGNGSEAGENYFGVAPTGGSQAHNIMQPYIVINFWKRTA